MRTFLLASFAALALAAPAAGGGWATAGLGPPDGGIGAGDTWNAEVTILQHGMTPLVGVQPAVVITKTSTGERVRFPAKPTDKPGVYRAAVKFPSSGEWRYAVYDGFTEYGGAKTHQFAPVQIGSDGGGFSLPEWTVGLALAAAGLALLGSWRGARGPRRHPSHSRELRLTEVPSIAAARRPRFRGSRIADPRQRIRDLRGDSTRASRTSAR